MSRVGPASNARRGREFPAPSARGQGA